ncbi:hypothetical protein PAA8504_03810 [Palleronia abyssalis]|uniref:Plasmid pRiA4b Orf3-like domain-containing protein n=1 Tax=Palleronia abyssalis TaxID=1501240 RepID=A0A2R8C0N4_9RHOB|nr:hypothetical protein PAA8504_03810 [Palleronia abyssalis]
MTIARLKITLEAIEPVVSRTLEVPVDIRLERLHLVIQAAMGWENYHLYEFMVGEIRWGLPDPDFGTDALPVAKSSLAGVASTAGTAPICYIYDFGGRPSCDASHTMSLSTRTNIEPRLRSDAL